MENIGKIITFNLWNFLQSFKNQEHSQHSDCQQQAIVCNEKYKTSFIVSHIYLGNASRKNNFFHCWSNWKIWNSCELFLWLLFGLIYLLIFKIWISMRLWLMWHLFVSICNSTILIWLFNFFFFFVPNQYSLTFK